MDPSPGQSLLYHFIVAFMILEHTAFKQNNLRMLLMAKIIAYLFIAVLNVCSVLII